MCFLTCSNHKLFLFLILKVFISEYDIGSQINTLSAGSLCLTVLDICLIFIHLHITQTKVHMCMQVSFHFLLDLSACLQRFIHT